MHELQVNIDSIVQQVVIVEELPFNCNKRVYCKNRLTEQLKHKFSMQKQSLITMLHSSLYNSSLKTSHKPSFQLLEGRMLDDLKRKYAGGRLLKYSKIPEEISAIGWYKKQLAGETIAAAI